ncbi:MAG TPA: leucyl/phenylalanyl-tRNA--protein transferase [Verrucomicrobiales bacterium]|nr:leucyl/phenylalanyl-tRNA--protein transferase [Verrucomicrobiales bacterium]
MSDRQENLAVLPPDLLLQAYAQGMFPMAMESGELGWFSPDPRGIIPIRDFHVPHGMKKLLRDAPFQIRINSAFATVMRGCANRDTTWISDTILRSYVRLHELGFAHSVEAWQGRRLVGGLYGVAIGGAFFGESMFSREPGASKIALHALVRRLDDRGFTLLDTQWVTGHLRTFGAHEIPRSEYMQRLRAALKQDCRFVDDSVP